MGTHLQSLKSNLQNQQSTPTYTMIIPTDDRLKIWRTLFSEGVMVAAKDTRSTHVDTKVRNLFVMNALKSLKSKGFVKENYTWQHYHYALPTRESPTSENNSVSQRTSCQTLLNELKSQPHDQIDDQTRLAKVDQSTETETVTDGTKTVLPLQVPQLPIKPVKLVPQPAHSNTKVVMDEVNQPTWNRLNKLINVFKLAKTKKLIILF